MQPFRRQRYQYNWAGIGCAYYGSLPKRPPENGSRNVNDVIPPTSLTTESSAQVDPKNAKSPRQDLNQISTVPTKGHQRRNDTHEQDLMPRKGREALAVLVDAQSGGKNSSSLRASRGSHGPKVSTQNSSGELRTNWKAMRRATHWEIFRDLRQRKLRKRNVDFEYERLLPSYDRQKGLEIEGGSSGQEQYASKKDKTAPKGSAPATLVDEASSRRKGDTPQTTDIEQCGKLLSERSEMLANIFTREGEFSIGHDIHSSDSQDASEHTATSNASEPVPWQPIDEPAATSAVYETDSQWLAQHKFDYGPAFAPYTTKLLKETEGWKNRPALWDIGPGCLLWLPASYKNPEDIQLRHPHPNSLDHPIVVLSVDVSGPEDAIITFMQIRSFKSRGAKTSLLNFWKTYLPISRFRREGWKDEPEARESWKDALLFMESYQNRLIDRVQYVNIGTINTARWEDLTCYQGQRRVHRIAPRLCQDSMAHLRAARTWWEGHFNTGRGLVKWDDEWVPTGEMREVFRQRYIELREDKDKVADDLGSVVAGKMAKGVSEGSGELTLQIEGVRAEIRAELEDARDKMRAELDKVRAETRAELMAEMLAEFHGLKGGLEMVDRAEKAVVGLQLAKSARPPVPQPEQHAASAKMTLWQAANDMPERSGDSTQQVKAMREELKMSRIEAEGVMAALGRVRAEMQQLRVDMQKMQVELALVKRAEAAREAVKVGSKIPDNGMYAPALGPRSSIVGATFPPRAADHGWGTEESIMEELKEELKQVMRDPAQTTPAPTPIPTGSMPPRDGISGPRLGRLAQARR